MRLPQCDSPTIPKGNDNTDGGSVGLSYHGSRNFVFRRNVLYWKIQYLCRKMNVNAIQSTTKEIAFYPKCSNSHQILHKYSEYNHSYENRNNLVKQEISE